MSTDFGGIDNPWPIAIRLIIGLAITIAFAVLLGRMFTEQAEVEEAQLRVLVFDVVYSDLEAGVARLKAWRQASGVIIFPGLQRGECVERPSDGSIRPVVNDLPWDGRGPAPRENTLTYVRLYNETLKNILISRYGVCTERLVRQH